MSIELVLNSIKNLTQWKKILAGNLKWIQNSKGHRFSVNILGKENFNTFFNEISQSQDVSGRVPGTRCRISAGA